jgi:predicted dehydrogenase
MNLPALLAFLPFASIGLAAEIRIGIIGCDTSHVNAFTETINNPEAKGHVAGGKVVAAYRGGSMDIPESSNRLDSITKNIAEKNGVKMYDSIEELCKNVDAVLLESLDGRPKLEQIKPVLAARKPVFVDKPMAASLRDVIEMFRLAKKAKVPIFSSSSLRFAKNTELVQNGSIGKVMYAETYGPCELERHHPDLFWYGIHGVEALYTVMGTGCKTVQRTNTPAGKIAVIGDWGGGREGIFAEGTFHGFARGEKGEAAVGSFDGYVPLVEQIMKFFQTKVAPVKPEETIEIFAFMEAADLSKQRGGEPVKISEVMRVAAGKVK